MTNRGQGRPGDEIQPTATALQSGGDLDLEARLSIEGRSFHGIMFDLEAARCASWWSTMEDRTEAGA